MIFSQFEICDFHLSFTATFPKVSRFLRIIKFNFPSTVAISQLDTSTDQRSYVLSAENISLCQDYLWNGNVYRDINSRRTWSDKINRKKIYDRKSNEAQSLTILSLCNPSFPLPALQLRLSCHKHSRKEVLCRHRTKTRISRKVIVPIGVAGTTQIA